MKKKILLAGVCYIIQLIEMRHSRKLTEAFEFSQPDFNIENVKLCSSTIEDEFLVKSQRGTHYLDVKKWDAEDRKFKNFGDMCRYYTDKTSSMYFVLQLHIPINDMMVQNYKIKSNNFWFYVEDENWDISTKKELSGLRKRSLFSSLKLFPNLKFVLIKKKDFEEWKRLGLPIDRVVFWDVDWGDKSDLLAKIEEEKILNPETTSFHHQYPSEQSYNDLYYQLLDDDRKHVI